MMLGNWENETQVDVKGWGIGEQAAPAEVPG